jgi:hypothetical protein
MCPKNRFFEGDRKDEGNDMEEDKDNMEEDNKHEWA